MSIPIKILGIDWMSEWFWATQKQHMNNIIEEGKQWCHPPDTCCTNIFLTEKTSNQCSKLQALPEIVN
jgi:hypothetical protein